MNCPGLFFPDCRLNGWSDINSNLREQERKEGEDGRRHAFGALHQSRRFSPHTHKPSVLTMKAAAPTLVAPAQANCGAY